MYSCHSPLRAVLLDVDGTLIDSNEAHAWAWHDALLEAGYNVPTPHIRPLIGMGADKLLAALQLAIEENSELAKKITEHQQLIFLEKYAQRQRATPGARELLLRLRSLDYTLVIASAAQKNELIALLECAGIRDLIDDAASSADACESKPAPDIILAALKKSGAGPEETIMLGDTRYDIASAGEAGVPVIAFRCGGSSDADLGGAAAIYDSPTDLLAHQNALIFLRAAQCAPRGGKETSKNWTGR